MGFLIAGVALAAVGAAAGAYGASKSGSQAAGAYSDAAEAQQAIAAQQQAAGQHAIAKAEAAIELGQDRVVASEMARFNVMAGLGMPGTYEQGYEDFLGSLGGNSPFTPDFLKPKKQAKMDAKIAKTGNYAQGMFKKTSKTVSTPGAGPINPATGEAGTATSEVTDYKVRPGVAAAKIGATRSGRMVSYMTAQADQLVRREGPLWEEIKQSVQGPIIEGAGQAHQELLEQIQTMAAKSGSARNRAVQMATELQASQQIMRDKQNQLWQSNLRLIEFGIDNARAQLSFNDSWISNRAGIRDEFNQMMNAFTAMRVSQIMPAEIGVANASASTQTLANQMEMSSGLARADATANMYGAIAGGLQSMGGSLMGMGTTGGGVGGYAGSKMSVGAPAGSSAGYGMNMGGQSNYASSTWSG